VESSRVAAWNAVHEAMPARWRPGPVTYDPGRHAWSVTACGPHLGRGKAPQTVTGTGETEEAALLDLDARLRGTWEPGGRLDELRARLRLAYVEGAEAFSRTYGDRPLTADELHRVVRRYVGR
jgi:hypothetical protein